ncbi:hypothetical protein GGR52DRAFT_567297 [Hypoxylon sp. FL1284]|nr:hypothetical protein GGR52DRAFT_567297 [Hypoxylon sp. FL1284]
MSRPIRHALSRPLTQLPRHGLTPIVSVRSQASVADPEPASQSEQSEQSETQSKSQSGPPQLVNELPDHREQNEVRLPRSVQAVYLQPLRREAPYGVPSCDIQLRSFSIPNLEFFCDFALRAAYYLNLPAFGPVPLPKIIERWTVPRSHFIFKKSQENFERITRRRLIQIRDGHPETVQIWLAYLQKHAYYGIGMKANMWEFNSIDVGQKADADAKTLQEILEKKMEHFGRDKTPGTVEKMRSEICARCRPLVASVRRQVPRSVPRRQQRRDESTTSDSAAAGGVEGKSEDELREAKAPRKKVVFSGIQPTGVPHLGNYLGALRQWKRQQDEARQTGDRLLFSVVDLHALTMPQEAASLRAQRREMLAALLAVGLDPDDGGTTTLFFQSSVPQHAELMWILSCTASVGYLGRMTQWKSKLEMRDKQQVGASDGSGGFDDVALGRLKLGLFSYPVLQAADILVHRATHVPVGADQRQHLEFARECATNFNHAFKDVLIPPETVTTPAARVMSLTHPHNKMSKSSPNHRSRILITARRDEVRSRVMGAVTDSFNAVTYDPVSRPGVANLLEILSQCSGGGETAEPPPSPKDLADRYAAGRATLADLKADVANAVWRELDGVRDRYLDFLDRKGGKWLDEIEAEGAEAARASAESTMKLVRHAVGIGPRP